MKLIIMHDLMNPEREVIMDFEDFSSAQPYNTGSSVRTKSTENGMLVQETPAQIRRLLESV